jgi:hypothetical protein
MLPEDITATNVKTMPMQSMASPHNGSAPMSASGGIHIDQIVTNEAVDIERALVRAQRAAERDRRERAIRPYNGQRR